MKKEKLIVTILSSVVLVGIVGMVFANADDETPTEDIVPTESVLVTETADMESVPSEEEIVLSEESEPSDTLIELQESETDIDVSESEESVILESSEDTVLETVEILESETEVSEEVITEETVIEATEAVNLYPYEDCMYLENLTTCYLVVDYDVKLSPDPNAEILCTLPAGTAINQTGIALDSPWIKVDIDGTEAYINIMAVSFDANNLSSQDYMSDMEAEELWLGINGWNI